MEFIFGYIEHLGYPVVNGGSYIRRYEEHLGYPCAQQIFHAKWGASWSYLRVSQASIREGKMTEYGWLPRLGLMFCGILDGQFSAEEKKQPFWLEDA